MLKFKPSAAAVAGKKLHCKNWQIEGPYRMIHNVLDPEVAKDPDNLIVYGGTGKAARSWECFERITQTLDPGPISELKESSKARMRH